MVSFAPLGKRRTEWGGGGHPKAGGARWPRMPAPTNSSYRSERFGWVGRHPPACSGCDWPPQNHPPHPAKVGSHSPLGQADGFVDLLPCLPKISGDPEAILQEPRGWLWPTTAPQQLWGCKSPSPTTCPPPPPSILGPHASSRHGDGAQDTWPRSGQSLGKHHQEF